MIDYSKCFCEANFFRPTGLGNRLFSWARAKAFSRQTGCKMLAPTWAHLRAASLLRGGIDYSNAARKILLFDNFVPEKDEVKGISRMLVRRACTVFPVDTLRDAYNVPEAKQGKQLISFLGYTAHVFDDLWQHRDTIFTALKTIAKPKWHPQAVVNPQPFIGINVRMGNDYRKVVDKNEFINNKIDHLQTPLDWYLKSLRRVRKMIGFNLAAIVISDGTEQDLKILLDEPNVRYASSRSAIGDLLLLTGSAFLIGAGRSSFSAWASFLGKIPTITIPGSNLQGYHVSEDISRQYVGEFDPDLPGEALYQVVKKLKVDQ